MFLPGTTAVRVAFVNLTLICTGAAEAGGSNDTSTSHMAIAAVSMHPFSRGNVHINSSNPLNLARLDPQHLGNDFGMN